MIAEQLTDPAIVIKSKHVNLGDFYTTLLLNYTMLIYFYYLMT